MDASGWPLAKAALLSLSERFIIHADKHTIAVFVFLFPKETQETVMCQPVIFV